MSSQNSSVVVCVNVLGWGQGDVMSTQNSCVIICDNVLGWGQVEVSRMQICPVFWARVSGRPLELLLPKRTWTIKLVHLVTPQRVYLLRQKRRGLLIELFYASIHGHWIIDWWHRLLRFLSICQLSCVAWLGIDKFDKTEHGLRALCSTWCLEDILTSLETHYFMREEEVYREWHELGYKVEVENILALAPLGQAGGDFALLHATLIWNLHNPLSELVPLSVCSWDCTRDTNGHTWNICVLSMLTLNLI